MLFCDGPKGNKFANAGVGENNIDSPLHFRNGLVKTVKVGQFGNVALNARNIAPDRLHGLVEFLLAAARDEDIGALFDEKLCRSQPNSFGAAGDNGGLAFKFFKHCFSSAWRVLTNASRAALFVLWESLSEHGSATFRLLFGGLILNDVPMLREYPRPRYAQYPRQSNSQEHRNR